MASGIKKGPKVKTIIHLILTDDERKTLAKNWNSQNKMVSREEVNNFVNTNIKMALSGIDSILNEDSHREPEEQVVGPAEARPAARRDRSVPDFVPSRGDEPYLYRPQDPELANVCSSLLNGLEFIEAYVWDKLERNRQ